MISNLDKSIHAARQYALKSVMRIRGTSYVRQRNNVTTTVTLHMEAIMLNISYNAVAISNIPMLSTPLTAYLTRGVNDSSAGSGPGPRYGYLSLNQTRKLVPLLETDNYGSNAMTTPVIGVWVYMQYSVNLSSTNGDVMSMLINPFVWGGCNRYLLNDNIHDRVFVDEQNKTFLLV